MATIGRTNGSCFNNTSRKSYISTAAFHAHFYTYTTSENNFVVTGNLSPVSGANSSTCPAGRILRENGRKLVPGAYPGITTYMVGVYDAMTYLSGFIDPNAKVFQIYNTDKPNFFADGVEPTEGTADRGPSMYTRGNVLGGGDLDISGSAVIYNGATVNNGATINNGATVNGGLNVASGNATVTNGSLTVTNGKLNLDASGSNAIVGTASMVGGTVVGDYKRQTVNTTAVTASSRVFLTLTGQNNVGAYSVENIVPGVSFQIVSNNTSDGSVLNWLIIN
jgi:hypothetical protein